MAFPYMSDECVNTTHVCVGHILPATPESYGGGFCVCPCHDDDVRNLNVKWIDQVRESCRERLS